MNEIKLIQEHNLDVNAEYFGIILEIVKGYVCPCQFTESWGRYDTGYIGFICSEEKFEDILMELHLRELEGEFEVIK